MYLFGICILVRSLLAYFAMEYNELILYFTSIVGITFWALYLFDLRPIAGESSAKGKKVWWKNVRPLHGTLYLLFSYLYYKGNEKAYIILIIDVLIGLLFWFTKENGNV